jgi:putative glutamine amidotransferase
VSSRKPVILIATSSGHDSNELLDQATLPQDYVTSVIRAGGLPLLVPPLPEGPTWRRLVALGDGVLTVGGFDINPKAYGQKPHPETRQALADRQKADARIIAWADRRKMPVFAICMGIQAINVHRHGTLVQHIPDRWSDALEHRRTPGQVRLRHAVTLAPGSRLAKVLGPRSLSVNSSHHQAVDVLGRHLKPVAWSKDGIIEAIEDDRPDRCFFGVQWHPENLYRERRHLALFRTLVREARRYKRS